MGDAAQVAWLVLEAILGGRPRRFGWVSAWNPSGGTGRQQIGVLAHAVAGPLDVYDDHVMEQPIPQGRGDDGIAEHLAPLGKSAVGRQDHGAAFVARVHQLKEQVSRGSTQCDVADLVGDQQLSAAEIADALPQAPLPVGLGQAIDDVGQRAEIDADWSASLGWTGSGCCFDRLPGVLILELHGAETAEGRVQPP